MNELHRVARHKLYFCILLQILAALLFTSGCSNNDPIKIGFIGGLTGRVADLGINGRNGVQLAVEEQNSIGGINGQKIKLLVKDDKQDKDYAQKGVQYLIDQNVAAIIGHMTSSMSMATQPLINKYNVLMLSPTTTTNMLSGHDDNFIRVCAPTKTYSTKLAKHMLKILDDKSVVLTYDLKNKAYTVDWVNDFRKTFEAGGGKVLKEAPFTSSNNVHFQEIVKSLMIPGAKGLIICTNALDAAVLCQQAKKLKWQVPVALSAWASSEKLIEIGGQAVEGVTVSQFFDRENITTSYQEFVKKFKARFNSDPGFDAINSYESTKIILQALAKKSNKESLKKYIIRTSNFDSLQGIITIDKFGDGNKSSHISIVKDGKFVTLE